LLPDFYSGATGLSGCFVRDFLSGALTWVRAEISRRSRASRNRIAAVGRGDVGIPAVLGTSTGLFEKFASQYVFEGRARNSGRMYELRTADWDAFTKVYDAVEAIDEKMSIPRRRFNQAYGRQSGEDTIIDPTIALESCLLPNTREELQYRLSMRGAALLASLRNPVETQTLLKIVYEIRSEIVHNGKLLSDHGLRRKTESLGSVVAKDFQHACEDVVRDVLRESLLLLAVGGSLADLCQELDDRILLGLTAAVRSSSTRG
jgi:Apea-like HEPN